jgi:hypothetical protein
MNTRIRLFLCLWIKRVTILLMGMVHTPVMALPTVKQIAEYAKEKPQMQLLIVNELMGYIEPCGCTIDLKLGSIERLEALIRSTRAHIPTNILTVGSHLFDHAELKEHSLAQERAKAKMIRTIMRNWPVDAHLDGALDTAAGEFFYDGLKNNIPLNELSDPTSSPQNHMKIIEKSGVKLGVIALRGSLNQEGQKSIITNALSVMKTQAIHLKVVISTLKRADLRSLAIAFPEVTLWILGSGAQEEMNLSPVEHTDITKKSYIVEAGDRGRHLAVIKLYGLKHLGPLNDTKGDRLREIKKLELKVKMRRQFASMSKSPFMQQRVKRLEEQLETLKNKPIPTHHKRIEYQLIPITKDLPSSKAVAQVVDHYQESLIALNMKTASQVKPPPANGNGYAGVAECSLCHPAAEEFWKTTRHAKAWQTLEKAKKTFDVGCVGCHVTGWQEPGGSALGHTKKLQDVQCEACHGPAAKHAEIGGGESYVKLKVPSEKCETCHNHLHSPKFEYESYLSKIIGPGHGQPLPTHPKSD